MDFSTLDLFTADVGTRREAQALSSCQATECASVCMLSMGAHADAHMIVPGMQYMHFRLDQTALALTCQIV